MIRALTKSETGTDEFRHLLRLAVEVGDPELDAILRDELPGLSTRGTFAADRIVAFVAFDLRSDPVTIEYIAVDEGAQGRGYGRALVAELRALAGARSLYAQTDDDAVDFYRRLGFSIETCDRDPRWPDRPRYDCLLPAAPA